MTFVDALAALQEGAVPTNEQTLAFLGQLEQTLPGEQGLSTPGSRVVQNSRNVLDAVRLLIAERNTGEEIQEFLWRTHGTTGQLRKDGLKFRWGKGVEEKVKVGKGKGKDKKKSTTKVANVSKAVKSDTVQGE